MGQDSLVLFKKMMTARRSWFETQSSPFDRLLSSALAHVARGERLLEVAKRNPTSVVYAIMRMAEIGVWSFGERGAWLLPFEGKQPAVQLDLDYRCLIDLACRSGACIAITPGVVRKGDTFKNGIDRSGPYLEHSIKGNGKVADAIAYYALAAMKNAGGPPFHLPIVMTTAEVEKHRDRSPSWKYNKPGRRGPWETDADAMGLKTVIRRLCKYLPQDIGSAEGSRLAKATVAEVADSPEDVAALVGGDEAQEEVAGGPEGGRLIPKTERMAKELAES